MRDIPRSTAPDQRVAPQRVAIRAHCVLAPLKYQARQSNAMAEGTAGPQPFDDQLRVDAEGHPVIGTSIWYVESKIAH